MLIPLGLWAAGILLNDPNRAGRLKANHLFYAITYNNTLVFKIMFFLPKNDYISFRKKKAIIPFQVLFRNHNGRFSI